MWLSATKCSRSSFVWTGSWHPWPSCMMIWQWNVIRQLFYHWSRGSHSRTSWLRWKKDWGMTRRMIAKSLHQGWANHWLELQRMMAIMHCWLCTEKQRVSNHPRWITVPWFSHRTLQCDWDIFVFKETWRHDCVSTFFLPTMDRIFRSGGNTNRMAGAILQNNETYFECFLSCLGLFLAFMSVVCLLKLMSSGPTCFFLVMFVTNLLGWRCLNWRNARIAGFGGGRKGWANHLAASLSRAIASTWPDLV